MHDFSAPSGKQLFAIWVYLGVLTSLELLTAYVPVRGSLMLGILVLLAVLAVLKAGLILAYFMHLRYERLRLALAVVPIVCVFIGLFLFFLPDSLRVRSSTPPASSVNRLTIP
jgi:cytochrome c oxidase subunit 4